MKEGQKLLWTVNVQLTGEISVSILVTAPSKEDAILKVQANQISLAQIDNVEAAGILEFEED